MKVWIVMQTTSRPAFGGEGYRDTKSIYGVYIIEEAADAVVESLTAKRQSIWSSTYEVEEFDVQL